MRTIDDDIADANRADLLRAVNPKVAKIQAKRDIKVAKYNHPRWQWSQGIQEGALAVAALLCVCLAIMVPIIFEILNDAPPNHAKDEQIHQERMLCIEKKGEWRDASNYCNFG